MPRRACSLVRARTGVVAAPEPCRHLTHSHPSKSAIVITQSERLTRARVDRTLGLLITFLFNPTFRFFLSLRECGRAPLSATSATGSVFGAGSLIPFSPPESRVTAWRGKGGGVCLGTRLVRSVLKLGSALPRLDLLLGSRCRRPVRGTERVRGVPHVSRHTRFLSPVCVYALDMDLAMCLSLEVLSPP